MSSDDKPLLSIHGHFYQPPRDDPFTGQYRLEPSAAPYRNWNERITAECYHPNAARGNYEAISFNLGHNLAQWMAVENGNTHHQIVSANAKHHARYGVPNALAQSMHHTILPLARGRDKRCQVFWGVTSFIYRFGHQPLGMWLPEMAVDYETLEVVAEAGIRFVIVSDEQVAGDLTRGAGPYKVVLSGDRSMGIFVRDRGLSNHLSFQMPQPGQVDEWISAVMTGRRPGQLSLIATDGETFGHHHRQGISVLQQLLETTPQDPYEITTLGRYFDQNPPEQVLEIRENTAWSCSHHLGRWVTGCPCTRGCGHWKGALRRALDNLSGDIDEVFADVVRRRGVAPWRLRDDYIRVLMGQVSAAQFLDEHDLGRISEETHRQILALLDAQVCRQRMFVSCAFFFEDLERIEPRYAIANAVQAMALIYYATGDDLTRAFERDLSVTVSPRTGRTGATILKELMAEAQFGASPLGGDMALSRPRGRRGGTL